MPKTNPVGAMLYDQLTVALGETRTKFLRGLTNAELGRLEDHCNRMHMNRLTFFIEKEWERREQCDNEVNVYLQNPRRTADPYLVQFIGRNVSATMSEDPTSPQGCWFLHEGSSAFVVKAQEWAIEGYDKIPVSTMPLKAREVVWGVWENAKTRPV